MLCGNGILAVLVVCSPLHSRVDVGVGVVSIVVVVVVLVAVVVVVIVMFVWVWFQHDVVCQRNSGSSCCVFVFAQQG